MPTLSYLNENSDTYNNYRDVTRYDCSSPLYPLGIGMIFSSRLSVTIAVAGHTSEI